MSNRQAQRWFTVSRKGGVLGRKSLQQRRGQLRQVLFEALEPRQLLAADILASDLWHEATVPLRTVELFGDRATQATQSGATQSGATQSGTSGSAGFISAEPTTANTPALGTNFEAINFNDDAANSGFFHIPPDPIGAAGLNHVVNVVNTSIEWYTKAGLALHSEQLEDFFSPLSPANDTFDPKVLYDQHAERFVVVTLERVDNGSPSPQVANTSRFLLAVSSTSDPTGAWSFQAIDAKMSFSGTEAWIDYPGIAVDAQAIYLTGNLFAFDGDGGNYQGTSLWILDKGASSGGLYAGGTSTVSVHDLASISGFGITTQPAHTFGSAPGNTGTWLVQFSGLTGGGSEFINVIRVDDPLGTPTFDQDFVNLGDIDDVGAMPNAPQMGSAVEIETNDRRALNAVWRDDALWLSTTIVPNSGPDAGQATAYWVKIDTSTLATPVLADQGGIGGENLGVGAHTYFPTLMVDSLGGMGMGFAISGPTLYGSAAFSGRLASAPAGTVQPAVFLAQGQAPYVRAFGGTRNRWGDYSGLALDPSDEQTFWGFNAYALSRGNDFGDVYQGEVENGRWGTRWGAFTLAPPQASNDAFADRIDLGSGISAAGSGSNVGYTGEPGEIAQSGTIHSAWWSWTAPSNGALDVDTFGSSFDTFLTLATGAAVNSLTGVASNDDSGGLQSRVTIDVTAGTQYQIAVDGYNENTGAIVLHLNFTAEGTEDFGDAPTAAQSGFAASYPTTLADNGPRHTPLAGFHLGTSIDTEGDGVPSAQANADDLTRGDDEDGVNFVGTPAIGAAEVVEVFLTNTAGVANPYLDAWIDFNQDGDWQDSGEQIYSGGVVAGSNAILFSVPANAQPGQTFARFRLHDGTSGLTVTGLAADGEVEDHLVSLAIPGVWVEQGPRGTINGQVESGTQPNERVAGAIHTVLAHPTDADTLYIGAVNGGIWKTTNATAVLPDWTPTTDFLHSLSIGAMAFDPTDTSHNTLVAATARYSSFGGIGGDRGAVYRSTDGADTWTELPSNGLSGENLSGVAARGDTIVVSSSVFAGGLFRSTDGGANFQPISSADFNSPGDNFTDLVVDESDPSGMRLYAANEAGGGPGGIYRSDDFGLTWTKVSGPGISADMEALLVNSSNIEMTVHPVSGRLYVAVLVSSQPQGIFYTDNGSSANPTWSQMDIPVLPVGSGRPLTGATNATPISITSAAHGLSSGQFVVINGVTGNTAANGFFRITVTGSDTFTLNGSEGNAAYVSGGTWTQVTGPSPSAKVIDEKTGAQGRIHFSIRVHPTDPDILFVGGDRQNIGNVIGDSTYGGAIFRGDASIPRDPSLIPSPQWDHATHDIVAFDASGGTVNGTAPHADSREMVFDANGNLIEVDDGGIFRRTSPLNNAGDWFSLAGNLGVIEFHDVAYDNNSNTLIGGTQDNGTHFQPAGQQWDMLSGGDGGDVVVDTVSMAATNQSVRYSSFQNLGGFRRSVWSSANALQSVSFPALTVSSGPPLTPQFKTPVELNAVDPNRLLFIGANGIYESTDQGATIALVGATHSVGFLQDATVYGGWQNGVPNPNVFYVGAGDDVRIRTAAGGAVTASDPDPSSGQTVRDVVMQSTNWAQAWAIDDDSVFQTNDAGLSWSDVTGNLMAIAGTALFSIQYVPGPIGALVVGGNLGVFTSLISSPHIWTEVGSNLPNAPAFDLQYDASDDVLVAGTLGRGAWTLPNASALLAGLPPAAPAVVPAGTLINGGANNRSGIHSMAFEFDQPVVATSAAALRLFNHTTGALVSTGGATLSGQGTTQLTWTALGELPNGRYTAEILASEVAGSGGNLAATYALEFHVLKGDLTGNATVDFADYAIVGANFDPLGGVSFREGDASGNGTVDFADYAVIGANFNPLGLPALTYDFGDASETGTSFLTTLPKGGAQHVIAGPRLGLTIDPEANGQPTIAADGDDTNGGLDEDGVAAFVMQPGRTANLVITATVTTTAVLNAWIDFDNNGDWDGPGEQIFVDEPLVDGSNSKSFSVPPNALVGNVNARFRLTEVGGYSHQGLAASGEVEDYLLPMTAAPPPSILAPPTDDGNVGLSLPETDAQQTQAAVVAEHDLVEQRACSPVSSAESSPLPEEDVSPHRLPEESPRTDGLVGPSQVRRSPEQDPAAFWAAEPSATVQAVAKRLPAEAVATEMLIFDQAQSDLPSQAVQEAWPTPAAHAAPEDVAWCPVWTADHEGEGIEQLVELLAFDVFEATGPRRPAG